MVYGNYSGGEGSGFRKKAVAGVCRQAGLIAAGPILIRRRMSRIVASVLVDP
jgi:hypothetical protein